MQREFDIQASVGSVTQQNEIGFLALTVQIDNPTNQWALVNGFVIPQKTMGIIYPLVGTTTSLAQFVAPPGGVQPPAETGAYIRLTYYDLAVPPSGGVSVIGGRTPYPDRNPATVLMSYSASLGPHAATARASYTIPTGQRAHLGSYQLRTESQGGYAGVGVSIETYIYLTTAGGSTIILKDAFLWRTNVDGALDEIDSALDTFIFGGDLIQLVTNDAGVGGTSLHYAKLNLLVFDAS